MTGFIAWLGRINFQTIVTLAVLSLFSCAFAMNPHEREMIDTVRDLAIGAVAFWIGSSRGAVENRNQLDKHLDRLAEPHP